MPVHWQLGLHNAALATPWGAALRLPLTCTASTPAGFDRSAQTAAMRVLSAPPRSCSRTRPRTCRWPCSPWHTAPCHTAACSAPRRMRKTAPPLLPAGLGQGEGSRGSVGVRGGVEKRGSSACSPASKTCRPCTENSHVSRLPACPPLPPPPPSPKNGRERLPPYQNEAEP